MVDPTGRCLPALQEIPWLGRPCSRLPQGMVYDWEETLLIYTILSEIGSTEFDPAYGQMSALDMQRLTYPIAWVVLNRISLPEFAGAYATISQAAFSGSAVRNAHVYEWYEQGEGKTLIRHSPLLETAMSDYLNSQQTSVSHPGRVENEAAMEYVDYATANIFDWQRRNPGRLSGRPSLVRGFEKVQPAVEVVLDEWCSGQRGPAPAINATFYATLKGLHYGGDPTDEINDQLGSLALRHGDETGSSGNFGWIGTSTQHWVLVSSKFSLAVEPNFDDEIDERVLGRKLRNVTEIHYP